MNRTIKKDIFIYVIIDIAISLITLAVNKAVIYSFGILSILIIGSIYTISNLKDRFILFSFNLGFAVFLFLGYFISYLKNKNFSFFSNNYFSSSPEAIKHACIACFISITIINVVYMLFHKEININGKGYLKTKHKINRQLYKMLWGILVISYLCRIMELIENLLLVKAVSYYESGNYLSTLPSIIFHASSLCYIVMFLILATFPEKKIVKRILLMISLLVIMQLICGKRGEAISLVLTCVFYIFIRTRYGIKDFLIPKKVVVITIILMPIIIYMLQAISITRDNQSYEVNIKDGISSFFESQGGSVKIIANSYDLKEEIESLGGHTFVLGEIRYYLKNNVVTRIFTNQEKRLRNLDDVYSGDNFLRTYGYAYAPVSYLNGVGAGSSYIAEVYHDGGYGLLVLANIFIAILLLKIEKIKSQSIISLAIHLNIFRYIALLPRGMYLDWFVNTFSVQNIVLYIVVWYCISKTKIDKLEIK